MTKQVNFKIIERSEGNMPALTGNRAPAHAITRCNRCDAHHAQSRAEDVVAAMNRLEYDRGSPTRISGDNGSEFSGGMMDQRAYSNHMEIDFNRRGKPTDNAIIESFNDRFLEACLNTHLLHSLDDMKEKIDGWRWHYNERRPLRSLEGLTPRKFADQTGQQGLANSQA